MAGEYLDQALGRCRAINNVELEPAILLAHARLARAKVGGVSGEEGRPQGSPLQGALAFAREAQIIAERSGYVLYLADIHNFLAQLTLEQGDRATAREEAVRAKEYATCNGPPHYYKVAYEDAERLF